MVHSFPLLSFLKKPAPAGFTRVLAAGFSVLLFGYLILFAGVLKPDLIDHIRASEKMIRGELRISHPVFFFLIQLFSGFTQNFKAEVFAGFLIFAGAHYFKITLSVKLAEHFLKKPASWFLWLGILSAQLAIGSTLFTKHYIIGSLSPNYFHNGTLTLSYPFALLFLLESLRFLEDENRKHLGRMMLTGFLLIVTKPSFLFVWIPVMPFFVLLKFGAGRKLLGILQVSVFMVVLIIAQSLMLKSGQVDFKVVFYPFYLFGSAWNHVLVLASALLFPLSILLLFPKTFPILPQNQLLVLFTLQGLLLSFLFHDLVKGVVSPNMTWQSSMVHYLWLVSGLAFLDSEISKGQWLKVVLPLLILGSLVFSCLRYLHISSQIRSLFI
jgi:hypothetical protein